MSVKYLVFCYTQKVFKAEVLKYIRKFTFLFEQIISCLFMLFFFKINEAIGTFIESLTAVPYVYAYLFATVHVFRNAFISVDK